MFEKEAEDSWQSKDLWYKINADESAYKTGFQDGYNKANEWHYPSKGEYPRQFENVLCYCKVVNVKFYCIGHTLIGGDNKIKWLSSDRSEKLNVYAWKEIVIPEEIKENDNGSCWKRD